MKQHTALQSITALTACTAIAVEQFWFCCVHSQPFGLSLSKPSAPATTKLSLNGLSTIKPKPL
jgi:hypothetical protein